MRDVIVIGGGPAGSTAATLLARHGLSVTLLERERFPRFQIGESLLPYNNDLFARLGVEPGMLIGSHIPKYGAYFVTADGAFKSGFRFDQRLRDPYRNAFQVKRAEFDHLLLRNAETHGVEVRQETSVVHADLSDPERAVVQTADGQTLAARFVIDASGHHSVVGSRVGERADVQSLRKIAFFAHFRNVPRAEGKDGGSTGVAILKNGWFWLIPVSDDVMSIGLVVDRDHYVGCGLDPEAIFARTVAASPWMAEQMKNAERITPVYARKDFSFRMRHLAGENYALVGDAAGFLDPIFSTGVLMAMKSAELVVDGVVQRLTKGTTKDLDDYARKMTRGLDKYLRFIEHFYDREFLEVFLQPSERWGILNAIVGVLAGDIFVRRNNRLHIALFFFLVKLQKKGFGIARRIDWDALPSAASA